MMMIAVAPLMFVMVISSLISWAIIAALKGWVLLVILGSTIVNKLNKETRSLEEPENTTKEIKNGTSVTEGQTSRSVGCGSITYISGWSQSGPGPGMASLSM